MISVVNLDGRQEIMHFSGLARVQVIFTVDEASEAPNTNLCDHVFGLPNKDKGEVIILERRADVGGDPKKINYIVQLTQKGYAVDPYKPDHTHVMTVYHSDLEYFPPPTSIKKAVAPGSKASDIVGASDFYSDKNNPIVRSFRSSMGRGLAGFITSLDFDYGSGADWVWETDLQIGRAPKVVKVSINFAPIHDIAPGLDAGGFNRAPLYPVGQMTKSYASDQWGEDFLDPANPTVQKYLETKSKLGSVWTEQNPTGQAEEQ